MVPLGEPVPVEHQPDDHPELRQAGEDAVEVEQPQQINQIRDCTDAEKPMQRAATEGGAGERMGDRAAHTRPPIRRCRTRSDSRSIATTISRMRMQIALTSS